MIRETYNTMRGNDITATDYRQNYNNRQLNKGVVFVNSRSGNREVYVFKLLGNMYTSNFNRDKPYCMDDYGWREGSKQGIVFKVACVIFNKVKRIEEWK